MSHDALPRKRISAVSQVGKGKGMAQVSKVQVVSSGLYLVCHELQHAFLRFLRVESVGIALEEARQIIRVVLNGPFCPSFGHLEVYKFIYCLLS